jgi:hypothetical protein
VTLSSLTFSYISGKPAVFTPGPTASTFYPTFTYGHAPADYCSPFGP